MQISFQYSPEILQRAHSIHYRKFFLFQSRLPLIMGVLAIWSGLLLFLILGKEGRGFLSISLIAFGMIAIGVYLWLMKTTGKRVFKKLTDYHTPFTFTISDESIFMTLKQETYEMPWEEIKKAVINPDMILLYPTEKMFYIFPEKNFTGSDFSEFEEMVKEKVPALF